MLYVVCCVCVFFPFILDIKFVGRTSRGHTGERSHRISHPSSFCGACLNFSPEKDSAISFPRRPCSRILCTNDLIVLHLLGISFFSFFFLVRKIPFTGIRTHVPTCRKVTRLLLSYRGDRLDSYHMWNQTLYYLLPMMIPFLLCRQKEEEPTKRHMECETVGEMSMPPLKCGCFGSAA